MWFWREDNVLRTGEAEGENGRTGREGPQNRLHLTKCTHTSYSVPLHNTLDRLCVSGTRTTRTTRTTGTRSTHTHMYSTCTIGRV